MAILPQLLLVYLGLIAAAFFSGYETGLISLNRVRLHHLVERKNRRALILEEFVNHSDKLLGTTLAGTNLAHVLVSVFATAAALRVFGAGYAVELLTMLVVAGVLLIVCEITPKTLFRRYPHRLCLTFADLLNVAAWCLAPVVVLLGLVMRAIYWLGGMTSPRATFSVTREELKHLAREGEVGGELTAEERQMILGVFDFPFKTVFEVMVPLTRTVTVGRDTALTEILQISQRTGFARFPVRDGTAILGVVNVYEALFEPPVAEGRTAEAIMRQPQLVLANERINLVLPRLRASRVPISVVVNPEGRPIGIITVEDIVEEIVGEVEG